MKRLYLYIPYIYIYALYIYICISIYLVEEPGEGAACPLSDAGGVGHVRRAPSLDVRLHLTST